MTARITSAGRNSWAITNTHRCHSVRIPGDISPMDHPRSSLSGWAIGLVLAAVVGVVLI